MPLTPFQKEVLHLLAVNRNPESHVAGGAVINRTEDSPRYSADLDLFHAVADAVLNSAEADAAVLLANGFTVTWLLRQPYLRRAEVGRQANRLRLAWCVDSAFRFFPVQADPDFGYCLHPADLATNKVLALAGRSEVRDYLDTLYLHEHYLGLGAMAWAACGKDQGFSPTSLLEYAKANVKFRQEELAGEHLAQPLRLTDLKETWLKAVAEAEDWFTRLPSAEVGCLYLDDNQVPCMPDPRDPSFQHLARHFGSVGGAWPTAGSRR